MKDRIQLFNEDNIITLKRLKDNSVDIICIDPPYLYLKNQKLEREFDFNVFFSECKRVLTKNGSFIMFGRGVSFWEMNLTLNNLGFKFKEEVIWNKRLNSSPVLPLGRCHESISIFQLGNAKINNLKVDFFEKNKFEPQKIYRILERLNSALGNHKSLDLLKKYFDNGFREYSKGADSKFNVNLSQKARISQDRAVQFASTLKEGQKESSIIDCIRDHYSAIHPTQKPVKLLIRLINLVLPQDKDINDVVIADFFGGSFSTMEAVYELGCKGVSCEIDKEYFELGKKRIEELTSQQKLF